MVDDVVRVSCEKYLRNGTEITSTKTGNNGLLSI